MEDFYYPSEIARLVLGYLDEVKCENSWRIFIEESEDLQEHCRLHKLGRDCSTNVRGESLLDILSSYCALKSFFNQVIYQNSWKSFEKDILYLQKHFCAYKNERLYYSNINGKVIVDVLKEWALKIANKSNTCPSSTSNVNQINFLYPDSVVSEKSPVNHHSVQIQTSYPTNRQNTADGTTQTEGLRCHSSNSSEDQLQQISKTDAGCSHDNDHRSSPTSNTNVQNEQRASNAEQSSNSSLVVEPLRNHDIAEEQSSQHSRFQLSPLQTPHKNGRKRMEEDCAHNEDEQGASDSNQLVKKQISELSKNSPSHGGFSRDRLHLLSYFTPKKNKINWTETEMTPLRRNLAQIQENLIESPFGKGIELAETPFKLDTIGNMILDDVKQSPEYNALLTIMSASKGKCESNLLTSPGISNMDTDNYSVDDEADHANETSDVEASYDDADNGLNSAVETVDLCEEMSVPNASMERSDSAAAVLNKESNSSHELPLENYDETESPLQSTNFNKEACMGSKNLEQNVNKVRSSQSISNSDEPDTCINIAQVCATNPIVQNSSSSNGVNECTNLESHIETNFEEQTALIDNISSNVDNVSDCLAENSALKESDKNLLYNSKSNVPQGELLISPDSETHATPHDSTTSLDNNCDKKIKELVLQSNRKDGDMNQNMSVNVIQQPVSQPNISTNIGTTSDFQHVTLPVITQPVVVQPNQASGIFSYPSNPTLVMQNYPVDAMSNVHYRLILNPLNNPITWNTSGLGNLCIPPQSLPVASVLNQRVIAPATNEVRRINAENAARNAASRKTTNSAPPRKKGGKLPASSNCDQNVNIRLPEKSPMKSRKEQLFISSGDFSHNPDIPILLPDKTPVKNNKSKSNFISDNGPSTSDELTCSPSVKSPSVTKSPPKRIERERSVSPRSNLRRVRDLWRLATATEQNKKYPKPKTKRETKKSPKSKARKKESSSKSRRSYALRSRNKSTTSSSKKSSASPSKKSSSSPSKKSSASPSKKSKKTPAKSPKGDIPVLSIPEFPTSPSEHSRTEILSLVTNQFEKELQSPVLKMLVPQKITLSGEDNAVNSSHVRCLNFGSNPPENANVGKNHTKKKKKVTKDKPVAESLDKKPATKKKEIKTSDNSNSKISEKKKGKIKKHSKPILEQNSDSVPKSVDTTSVECVVLNNEPCSTIQHEPDMQIRNEDDILDFITVEEHNVNINVEESDAQVAVDDSVVQNNAAENNSEIVESTKCHVPTTDERTVSNIEELHKSVTQVIPKLSKQKKEFKKNSSPCTSRKGSPKILQKAINKRKMRPPKKRLKSDNLDLSVVDRSLFNLNSYQNSGSKLGGVESISKSILPSVIQKTAVHNSRDDSEDIEAVDLCEKDHISSVSSCSASKSKPQSPSAVDNVGCQKIVGDTSVPVDNKEQTKNTANELPINKLQRTSPEKSHQLDSSLASEQQEQPLAPSYLPVTKSYLTQVNKQSAKEMDVELPISSADSAHHIYFSPEVSMPKNSEIPVISHSDSNEKNISSECNTENETSNPEMTISGENSNLLRSLLLKSTFPRRPFKKRPPILSSFRQYNISNAALLKLKEKRAMKDSHSGSLNEIQSDLTKKMSVMDKDKATSCSNLAFSAETGCLQLSSIIEVANEPKSLSKSAESNEQMDCKNIVEKPTAGETEDISDNIASNVNCPNEMPVDMDSSFHGRKRRLSESSCELQIVLNDSMASSVESSPFVVKRRRNCKPPSSSEASPSSSPQKRKEVIIQDDRVFPEDKDQSSPSKSSNLNEILENNVNEGTCNKESNLNSKKLPDSPVRCISKKKTVHKSALSKKIEKDPSIPAGVKIPSKWKHSNIKQYSNAIQEPMVGDKKTGKGKKQTEKKTKRPVDAGKTVTFKPVKMQLNDGKKGVSKKLFPETIEGKNACDDNKLSNFLFEENKINNAYVQLRKLSHKQYLKALNGGEIEDTMPSENTNDNFQTSNETALSNKITGATMQSQSVNVTDDSENLNSIVESDIGMSTEKERELATAIATCEKEVHNMQSNQHLLSPKKNQESSSSKESENATSTGLTLSSEKIAFILSLTKKISQEELSGYLK